MSDLMSQPGEATRQAFAAAMGSFAGASEASPEVVPAVEPQTPAETPAATETPAAPAFDPATIRIPDSGIPKHMEKYRGKTLDDVANLELQTQRYASEKAAEAARLSRENAELHARLAAAEQVTRMVPRAPEQPEDIWAQTGINPDEALFTNPRGTLAAAISLGEQRARAIAAEEARKSQAVTEAKLQQERLANSAIVTFETAKDQIRKSGYEVGDEDWVRSLGFIAPRLAMENNGVVDTNPSNYVQAFMALRGAPPKASIPQEGNPPVATKASTASPQTTSIPSVSAETRTLLDKMGDVFKAKGLMDADGVRDWKANVANGGKR